LPLAVKLVSRGEICPLRGIFTLSFTPRGEHSLLKDGGANREFHPTPWITSPLGVKFAPRGEVKNGHQGGSFLNTNNYNWTTETKSNDDEDDCLRQIP
jgi:hypothetical protein